MIVLHVLNLLINNRSTYDLLCRIFGKANKMSILGGAMIKIVFSCLLSMSGGKSIFFSNRGAPVDLH